MAEALKDSYGPEIPKKIAEQVKQVYPKFNVQEFLKQTLQGYEALNLMPRGWHIARMLRKHLPERYEEAIEVLLSSLSAPLQATQNNGMYPFLYMPHVFFVSLYGLDSFELSMKAQYELTQRFTAEFSIRAYIERYPKETFATLARWATDPNVHVRRLVSEGTRPRLPWANRIKSLQKDPRPILPLLEILKDDPEIYVRKSVANNLNDIGKDHPEILNSVAQQWLMQASDERIWLVKHALRTAIKRKDLVSLKLLGYQGADTIELEHPVITPKKCRIGSAVQISFSLKNTGRYSKNVMVDFQIHYVKANKSTACKVFKLKSAEIKAGAVLECAKKISLKEMTTRKHYAGLHRVDAVINGKVITLGAFTLLNEEH